MSCLSCTSINITNHDAMEFQPFSKGYETAINPSIYLVIVINFKLIVGIEIGSEYNELSFETYLAMCVVLLWMCHQPLVYSSDIFAYTVFPIIDSWLKWTIRLPELQKVNLTAQSRESVRKISQQWPQSDMLHLENNMHPIKFWHSTKLIL